MLLFLFRLFILLGIDISAVVYKTLFLFDIIIVYSYVIEFADFESDLGLHGKVLVLKIFAFYHLVDYARGRLGRRGHVHFG